MNVVPFPPRRPMVFIDPVMDNNGEWGVFLQRPGRPAMQVTSRLAFPAAEAVARRIAEQNGAEYLDDTAPEPGSAA